MVVTLEREGKYTLGDGAVLPDISGVLSANERVEESQVEHLDAVYYDTADFRLLRYGVTLRRRMGGEDEGWHLKLPTSEKGARYEIHERFTASEDVPERLEGLVFAYTLGEPLRPTVRIVTNRRTRRLVDRVGRPLAALTDDDVRAEVFDSSRPLTSWREVELERYVAQGKPVRKIIDLLERAGARDADYPSKLARAVDLSDSDLPDATVGVENGVGRPAAALVGKHLRALHVALLRRDVDVRRDRDDAVHKMRVEVRRLRSALRTDRPLFSRSEVEWILEELAWLAEQLGRVRDLEVLRERIEAGLRGLPVEEVLGAVRARLETVLASEHGTESRELARAMVSDRYVALLGRLDNFVTSPPFTTTAFERADRVLPRLLRKDDLRLRARVRALEEAHGEQERASMLHAVRRAAKRVRYGAEAVEPIMGKRARRYASRLEAVQEVLGDHHDAIVARSLLRAEGARAGATVGENGYTYGLLAGLEMAARDRDEEAFGKLWRKVGHNRL